MAGEYQAQMAAAYRKQVQEVMDAAGWPWPEELLLDPAKGPRFVESVDEFLRELQLGSHMDGAQIPDFPSLAPPPPLHPLPALILRIHLLLHGPTTHPFPVRNFSVQSFLLSHPQQRSSCYRTG
eukprot:SAG11_NODE_180_length_13278_cov_9.158434_10_plen_124_part_00